MNTALCDRLYELAFARITVKRELAAVNDANVHLRTHYELVEVEKRRLELRIRLLRLDNEFDLLCEELKKSEESNGPPAKD